MPPPAERRKRPQDGISWVQKVAAVEKVFRGSPGCFQGIRVYIGEGSRSVELRGAHDGGGRSYPPGRALLLHGRLVASLTPTASLLDCVCSKNDPREGFIPVGFSLITLFRKTLKLAKKTAICTWLSVNRLVPKII